MNSKFYVHESSYIDDNVQIGEGTKIWHFCHIQKGARIGQGCSMGQNVNIGNNVVIGDNVKIQNNVSVYEGVTVEEGVFLGPSMVFTNVITPRSMFPTHGVYQKTLLKRGCSVGANATIVCGTTIGEFALVGAGSVITKDVPAHALVYGNPARVHGYVCECGNKMNLVKDKYVCPKCNKEYMLNTHKGEKENE